eukprot:746492-Amphidinium_carterae.1
MTELVLLHGKVLLRSTHTDIRDAPLTIHFIGQMDLDDKEAPEYLMYPIKVNPCHEEDHRSNKAHGL